MGCSKCHGFVSDGEYDYSIEKYGKILCMDCQQNYSLPKNKYNNKEDKATPEAKKLCQILIKKGFDAELEKWDGHKHIDIALPKYKVNIEVDGKHHQSKKQALADLKRTFHSFKKGYVTLRIPNSLVQENIYKTAGYIMKFLNESEAQLEEDLDNAGKNMQK